MEIKRQILTSEAMKLKRKKTNQESRKCSEAFAVQSGKQNEIYQKCQVKSMRL